MLEGREKRGNGMLMHGVVIGEGMLGIPGCEMIGGFWGRWPVR